MTVSPFFINEFSIRNENSPHSTIPTIPTISTIDDRLLFSGTLMSTAVKILRGSKQLSFENGAIKLSITLKLNVKSDLDNAKLIVTIADRKIGTINQSPTPSAPVKFQATLNPFRNPNINYQEVLKSPLLLEEIQTQWIIL